MPLLLPWLLILAALWGPVIFVLGAQWMIHPQYHYGWFVPALCLFLAWERSRTMPATAPTTHRWIAVVLIVIFGFMFGLSRLLQESNPVWRAPGWGLAVSAGVMTLGVIYLLQGSGRAIHFAFPVLFFLLAVPWPNFVELSAVRHLTRWNTAGVVEILSFLGVPALQHGNVIEVSTGVMGVEEACSGIRSLQGALMLSVFFGEFYPVSAIRRLLLVGCGIAAALFFNLCRTCFLTFMAARHGPEIVQKWHDSAGVSVLVICSVSIWLLAILLRRFHRMQMAATGTNGQTKNNTSEKADSPTFWKPWPVVTALVSWAGGVEAANSFWFGAQDSGPRDFGWSVRWSEQMPGYHTREISSGAYEQLRYDRGLTAAWTDEDGRDWQAIYLQWLPAKTFYGRARTALAVGHSPEICLSGSGWKMEAKLPPATLLPRPDLPLAFDHYLFRADEGMWHVFFAVIEDRPEIQLKSLTKATRQNKIHDALAGGRVFGQRIIEVAIRSSDSSEEAIQNFQRQLSLWVKDSKAESRK